MNVAEFVARAGRLAPDRLAVALGETPVYSHRMLAGRVAAVAGGLRKHHSLTAGDRVAIVMTNCPEYVEVLFSIWHAGLIAVPINAKLHAKEIAHILGNSAARACFVSADLFSTVASPAATADFRGHLVEVGSADYQRLLSADPIACRDCSRETIAWLFYTSGTTGRPKGASLTHGNLVSMSLSYVSDVNPISWDNTIVHAAPMSHGSGLYILPHAARCGCQVIPESRGFDAVELLRLLERHRQVSAFLVPTIVRRLIENPRSASTDFRNLSTIIYGGAPMYLTDLKAAIAQLPDKLVQVYGQGESPMTISRLDRSQHSLDGSLDAVDPRLASAGVPYMNVEVRIVDSNDHPLEFGEVGEIVTRSDVMMAGYWENPDATAAALRGGWLHTGDVGRLSADGFLTLLDRNKDMIISGGTNIYPREIEDILLTHRAVAEVSVVGRPHPDWGEEVVAFIVPNQGQSVLVADLEQLCLENIARFKRPREYRLIEALPKSSYGKILKSELRKLI